MIRPISAALVQKAPPPARVRRRGVQQTVAAESGFLEEVPADPVERPPPGVRSATTGVDGTGARSAQRTVAAELLAVLMTLRHGG